VEGVVIVIETALNERENQPARGVVQSEAGTFKRSAFLFRLIVDR